MGQRIYRKKTIAIVVCLIVTLLLLAMTGCGGDKKQANNDGTNTDAIKPLDNNTMTEPTTEAAPVSKTFKGTVEESYNGLFVVKNDSETKSFGMYEDTKFNLDGAPHIYIGDKITVTYQKVGKDLIAEKVDMDSRDSNFGDFAASLCWPYGQMSKGRYDGGSMTEAYATWFNRLRPNEDSHIKGKQWNSGASCDIFVATAVRAFGVYDFPVELATQCDYFFLSDNYKECFEKVSSSGSMSNMQHGDIGICINKGSQNNGQGHIFVVNKSGGHNWRSNAHYRVDNGYYGVIDGLHNYSAGKYKYFGVFRLK